MKNTTTQAGWRLVPEEPTEAMYTAGWDAHLHFAEFSHFYRAMLAAAPVPTDQAAPADVGSVETGRTEQHEWFMGEAVGQMQIGSRMEWVEQEQAIDRLHCGTFLGLWEDRDGEDVHRIAFCTMDGEGDIWALGDNSAEDDEAANPSWRRAEPDKILVPLDGYNAALQHAPAQGGEEATDPELQRLMHGVNLLTLADAIEGERWEAIISAPAAAQLRAVDAYLNSGAALATPASRSAGADGWRDMKDAPKDGTRILVNGSFGVRITSWGICRLQPDGYRANQGEPTWRSENEEHIHAGTKTGWMPLPSGDK